mmetsp:Transcript_1522/g.2790  ORF Transcript_1522/g.2790 Transcript_1522/m.2790 type:complete len:86 (-) Transcript_1522:33-290(-)
MLIYAQRPKSSSSSGKSSDSRKQQRQQVVIVRRTMTVDMDAAYWNSTWVEHKIEIKSMLINISSLFHRFIRQAFVLLFVALTCAA